MSTRFKLTGELRDDVEPAGRGRLGEGRGEHGLDDVRRWECLRRGRGRGHPLRRVVLRGMDRRVVTMGDPGRGRLRRFASRPRLTYEIRARRIRPRSR